MPVEGCNSGIVQYNAVKACKARVSNKAKRPSLKQVLGF